MSFDSGRRRPETDRFGLDSALLLAYVACFVIVIALLPLGGHLHRSEATLAIGLQAFVGLLLGLGPRLAPRLGLPRPRFIGLLGISAYLASVALLRDAAPPTSGYGPLALLPVVWASLRGGRGDLPAAMIGIAALYSIPTLLVGNPQYPVGVWRAAMLMVVLSVVIGLVVRRLVGRVDDLFRRLTDLARTDALTGLPNRRAWQEHLEREAASARRTGQPFTIALIDLDGFKPYNDSHGHLAGDRLLLSITAAWRTALRGTDVLARWGGDEFILLLPACTAAEAEGLLERMCDAFPAIRFSTGLAESDGARPPETLLAVADEDLYRAKRERKGAPATLRADADYESTRPQGPGSPQEEARNAGVEVR